MKSSRFHAIAAAAALLIAGACAEQSVRTDPPAPPQTLRAFRSEAEFTGYYRQLVEESLALQRKQEQQAAQSVAAAAPPPEVEPQGVEAPITADAASMEFAAEGREGGSAESVTNVQHAGVDEGGIVKVHGDYLVMLRRGRLFTVRVGDGALAPVSAVNAFGPDVDPGSSWYDELLVSGNIVVVIGFSYQRGGTEIGLFDIDRSGHLTYRATYHMRSDDYYSSRNYASRLVGGKLIFYTPLRLTFGDDPYADFPAVRRWHRGAQDSTFHRILPPTRVYRPERPLHAAAGLALHTVTVCDLAGPEMTCEGSAVVGPAGRVFYVSPASVYVWVTDFAWYDPKRQAHSMLYRMPLDGSAPSALTVSGAPVDQFSFLESEDAHINVVVRSDAHGEGMWGSERAAGDVGLLRVPVASFGDGSETAPPSAYRSLPRADGYTFQNRFVGEYLLYGTGNGWGPPEGGTSRLVAVRWAGGVPTELPLPHGVDRIEVMGSGAVVVGTDGRDLHFSGVRLDDGPRLADRYTRADASQGETRSHGFFYRAEGRDAGLLGLPIRGPGRPGYEHLMNESASVLFLRNQGFHLAELGALDSRPESVDDGCVASCVDWYGNARPLFLRGRILALMGYEIVEGALVDGRLRETRRVSYAPRARDIARGEGK